MHPGDYVNVPAGAKNINQSAATPINIDQSAATAKNIDRSAGVISSEKLDEFEASLRRDPLNQLGAVDSSMPVKTVARSEQLDVDDPKWVLWRTHNKIMTNLVQSGEILYGKWWEKT